MPPGQGEPVSKSSEPYGFLSEPCAPEMASALPCQKPHTVPFVHSLSYVLL